jgi:hypothetical protein
MLLQQGFEKRMWTSERGEFQSADSLREINEAPFGGDVEQT